MFARLFPVFVVLSAASAMGCSAGSAQSSTPSRDGSETGGAPSAGAASAVGGVGGNGSAGDSSRAGSGFAGSAAGVASGGGGAGGVTTMGGSAGTGGAAGASAVSCASLPLCDDFEGVAAGSPPDPEKWSATVLVDCASTAPTKPTVDDSQHHSGTRSLKITGSAAYCDYAMVGNAAAFKAIGNVVYGRYYVRFEAALTDGHVAFMAFPDDSQAGKALRMGGQNKALQWNRQSDDATLPAQSPAGIALSKVPPVADWMCLEFMIDQAQGLISTWVDGTLVTGLVADASPTPDIDSQWGTAYKPELTSFNIGWQNYGSGPMNLWFDDVALSATRIGCN
jgi:hypothetical protein